MSIQKCIIIIIWLIVSEDRLISRLNIVSEDSLVSRLIVSE